MEQEQEVWKPQVGKTAWAVFYGAVGTEVRQVVVERLWTVLGEGCVYVKPWTWEAISTDRLFGTALEAQTSIPVFDLEGKEVQVARAGKEIEALAMHYMLSDEAGQQNYSWEYCLQMASRQIFSKLGKNQDGRTGDGC